ncbi:MAG: hypothetical protein KTR31_34305 [Myxococcales bacterium]|nr:hypothetical protein [Myxococcales bacterium]
MLGHWFDGEEGEVDAMVTRGEGAAEWVDQESGTQTTRQPGFGSVYLTIGVSCPDGLRVPVEASVTSEDGALAVDASGPVHIAAPGEPVNRDGVVTLSLQGAFGDAVFPAMETDPDDYTDKRSTVDLDLYEDGAVTGAVGWTGEQTTADTSVQTWERAFEFDIPPTE